MYGGSGTPPAGSPSSRTRHRPSPSVSSSSTPGSRRSPARSRREGRASASHSSPASCSTSSTSTAPPLSPPQREARRDDARVVHDDELAVELVGQLAERAMPDVARGAVVDEQA